MNVITFCNLVQDDNFRAFVEKRIAKGTGNDRYSFPYVFPPLYRYRPFSGYAVDDIINGNITITRIGEFNDLFDGAFHKYGTYEERQRFAEDKWNEFESHRLAANLPAGIQKHDDYVNTFMESCKVDSRLKFRELDYLGTYVGSFSTERSSILMWSHYANYNTGICIEYDFNPLSPNSLLRKAILPVAYSQKPIDLRDLLADNGTEIYKYPLDAAVLCSALNKSNVWCYEKEWRLIVVLVSAKDDSKRIPIKYQAPLCSISLGYHFLKSFFYYNFQNKNEIDGAKKQIKEAKRLLGYAKEKAIPILIMTPFIGGYQLMPQRVSVDSLLLLIDRYFRNGTPENIRYYYVVHDELMDIIERETQNV